MSMYNMYCVGLRAIGRWAISYWCAYNALLDSFEALATTVATASASAVVAAVPEMCA